jgi:hypothetical protein
MTPKNATVRDQETALLAALRRGPRVVGVLS